MKKKLLSILLTVSMLLTLAPAAFAAEASDTAATITAYQSDGTQVGTTFTTISAAVNAAGTNGKVAISEGVVEIDARQGISMAGVTVEGAGRDKTFLVPSANFKNASTSDKKALLTIAADNVTVKGMSVDGSVYGTTVTGSTDFVVIRINDGDNVVLNDVFVTGSYKTLMQVGTSSVSAAVTAEKFYCEGMTKSVSNAKVYADIDVNTGSELTVSSGAVNGFVATETGATLAICEGSEPLYTLTHTGFLFLKTRLTSTFQHFADTYVALKGDLDEVVSDYASDLMDKDNKQVVANMVTYAASVADEYPDAVSNLIVLLTDAQEYSSDEDVATLQAYVETLNNALRS